MTTKPITNEMAFEKLGWRKGLVNVDSDRGQYTAYFQSMGWILPDGTQWTKEGSKLDLPDPLHDLNATEQYLLPVLMKKLGYVFMINHVIGSHWRITFMRDQKHYDGKTLALAIYQAFMDLPEEEKK